MRRLDHCSNEEVGLLVAIVSLAKQLPYEMVHYTHAFGELTSKYFTGGGVPKHRDPNPSGRSVAMPRPRPRVTL